MRIMLRPSEPWTHEKFLAEGFKPIARYYGDGIWNWRDCTWNRLDLYQKWEGRGLITDGQRSDTTYTFGASQGQQLVFDRYSEQKQDLLTSVSWHQKKGLFTDWYTAWTKWDYQLINYDQKWFNAGERDQIVFTEGVSLDELRLFRPEHTNDLKINLVNGAANATQVLVREHFTYTEAKDSRSGETGYFNQVENLRVGGYTFRISATTDFQSGSERNDIIDLNAKAARQNNRYQSSFITAGAGNDTVYGGLGDDVIIGGAGNDMLHGGQHEQTSATGSVNGAQFVVHKTYDGTYTKAIRLKLYEQTDAQGQTTLRFVVEAASYLVGYHLKTIIPGAIGTNASLIASNAKTSGYGAQSISLTLKATGERIVINNEDFSKGVLGNYKLSDLDLLDVDSLSVEMGGASIGKYADGRAFGNGSNGSDHLIGGAGNDTLHGGSGSDRLEGGLDNDILWGGREGDVLDGGDGNDILQGDEGNDVLRFQGNFGHDTSILSRTGSKYDADSLIFDLSLPLECYRVAIDDRDLVIGFASQDGGTVDRSVRLKDYYVGKHVSGPIGLIMTSAGGIQSMPEFLYGVLSKMSFRDLMEQFSNKIDSNSSGNVELSTVLQLVIQEKYKASQLDGEVFDLSKIEAVLSHYPELLTSKYFTQVKARFEAGVPSKNDIGLYTAMMLAKSKGDAEHPHASQAMIFQTFLTKQTSVVDESFKFDFKAIDALDNALVGEPSALIAPLIDQLFGQGYEREQAIFNKAIAKLHATGTSTYEGVDLELKYVDKNLLPKASRGVLVHRAGPVEGQKAEKLQILVARDADEGFKNLIIAEEIVGIKSHFDSKRLGNEEHGDEGWRATLELIIQAKTILNSRQVSNKDKARAQGIMDALPEVYKKASIEDLTYRLADAFIGTDSKTYFDENGSTVNYESFSWGWVFGAAVVGVLVGAAVVIAAPAAAALLGGYALAAGAGGLFAASTGTAIAAGGLIGGVAASGLTAAAKVVSDQWSKDIDEAAQNRRAFPSPSGGPINGHLCSGQEDVLRGSDQVCEIRFDNDVNGTKKSKTKPQEPQLSSSEMLYESAVQVLTLSFFGKENQIIGMRYNFFQAFYAEHERLNSQFLNDQPLTVSLLNMRYVLAYQYLKSTAKRGLTSMRADGSYTGSATADDLVRDVITRTTQHYEYFNFDVFNNLAEGLYQLAIRSFDSPTMSMVMRTVGDRSLVTEGSRFDFTGEMAAKFPIWGARAGAYSHGEAALSVGHDTYGTRHWGTPIEMDYMDVERRPTPTAQSFQIIFRILENAISHNSALLVNAVREVEGLQYPILRNLLPHWDAGFGAIRYFYFMQHYYGTDLLRTMFARYLGIDPSDEAHARQSFVRFELMIGLQKTVFTRMFESRLNENLSQDQGTRNLASHHNEMRLDLSEIKDKDDLFLLAPWRDLTRSSPQQRFERLQPYLKYLEVGPDRYHNGELPDLIGLDPKAEPLPPPVQERNKKVLNRDQNIDLEILDLFGEPPPFTSQMILNQFGADDVQRASHARLMFQSISRLARLDSERSIMELRPQDYLINYDTTTYPLHYIDEDYRFVAALIDLRSSYGPELFHQALRDLYDLAFGLNAPFFNVDYFDNMLARLQSHYDEAMKAVRNNVTEGGVPRHFQYEETFLLHIDRADLPHGLETTTALDGFNRFVHWAVTSGAATGVARRMTRLQYEFDAGLNIVETRTVDTSRWHFWDADERVRLLDENGVDHYGAFTRFEELLSRQQEEVRKGATEKQYQDYLEMSVDEQAQMLVQGSEDMGNQTDVLFAGWAAFRAIANSAGISREDLNDRQAPIFNSTARQEGKKLPPLILDLNADGEIDYSNQSVAFDVDDDGENEKVLSWAGPSDAFLAYDDNSNGVIDQGREISFTSYLKGAQTDLEGLAAFDTNGDGVLSAADKTFGDFFIWQDRNQDGRSQVDELKTLKELRIVAISLQSDGVERYPNDATHEHGRTLVHFDDGATAAMADVALRYAQIKAAHVAMQIL
jgi:Ca2+-binding RTX toxin-like protein